MSQNLRLDPLKKDYVLQNGSPVPTDEVQEAAYYALMIPRDHWMYGESGQGSELYKFKNAKRISSTEKLFADRVIDALYTQLVSPGIASFVDVKNLDSNRNGTSNEIDIVPNEQNIATALGFKGV